MAKVRINNEIKEFEVESPEHYMGYLNILGQVNRSWPYASEQERRLGALAVYASRKFQTKPTDEVQALELGIQDER